MWNVDSQKGTIWRDRPIWRPFQVLSNEERFTSMLFLFRLWTSLKKPLTKRIGIPKTAFKQRIGIPKKAFNKKDRNP